VTLVEDDAKINSVRPSFRRTKSVAGARIKTRTWDVTGTFGAPSRTLLLGATLDRSISYPVKPPAGRGNWMTGR